MPKQDVVLHLNGKDCYYWSEEVLDELRETEGHRGLSRFLQSIQTRKDNALRRQEEDNS